MKLFPQIPLCLADYIWNSTTFRDFIFYLFPDSKQGSRVLTSAGQFRILCASFHIIDSKIKQTVPNWNTGKVAKAICGFLKLRK